MKWLSGLFGRWSGKQRGLSPAELLLAAVSQAARDPAYFRDFGVADTIDGRFDMMCLAGTLAFSAAQAKPEGGAVLADRAAHLMFESFDDALRNLGIGDSGVGRRMRSMAEAYLGRAAAYTQALAAEDRPGAFQAALLRNLYRGNEPAPGVLEAMARHFLAESDRLRALPISAFESGDLAWRPAPSLEHAA